MAEPGTGTRRKTLVLSGAAGIPLYGPSGASAHLRGVVRAFQALGDDVRVAVPRSVDRRGGVDDDVGVPVITCEPRRWSWMPKRFRERRELWDGRRLAEFAVQEMGVPDLIWERYSLFCDGGTRLAKLTHPRTLSGRRTIPRVLEVNAPLSMERARFERVHDPHFAQRVERKVLQSADRVLCVSQWLVDWAVAMNGCDPQRVLHVPNGVEYHGEGDREATRARLGLTGLVVGFVGTMKPWHGVERLPAILDQVPEATALVVGDGPESVPTHPRLRWVGRVEPRDLRHYVAAMDVGLAPYRGDSPPWFCPLKILEYKAQGVPVVAAAVGDCAHLVRDGSGEVVDVDAPSAWAKAIRRQANSPRTPRIRDWRTVVAEGLASLDTK